MASRLLDADMSTLWNLLSRGVEWWCEEMRAMLPRRWREAGAERTRVIVRREGDSYRYDLVTSETWTLLQTVSSGQAAEAVLCLPAAVGLIRTVTLPVLPASDMRRMVGLDIDRLTPFTSDQALFDAAILSRDATGMRVSVAVVPRQDVTAALEHARSHGIVPAGLVLADGDGVPRFDFRAALAGRGGRLPLWTPTRLWAVTLLLVAANVAVFTLRDIAALDDLRQRAETRRPLAQAAEKLRDATGAETVRRTALKERKRRNDPLPLLANLTQALPDEVWVQRLEWDGVTLRLSGWSMGGSDVLALVEADPLLRNARLEASSSVPNAQRQPFEIVAERDEEGVR